LPILSDILFFVCHTGYHNQLFVKVMAKYNHGLF